MCMCVCISLSLSLSTDQGVEEHGMVPETSPSIKRQDLGKDFIKECTLYRHCIRSLGRYKHSWKESGTVHVTPRESSPILNFDRRTQDIDIKKTEDRGHNQVKYNQERKHTLCQKYGLSDV